MPSTVISKGSLSLALSVFYFFGSSMHPAGYKRMACGRNHGQSHVLAFVQLISGLAFLYALFV